MSLDKALAALNAGDLATARRLATRAAKADGRSPDPHQILGLVAHREGDYAGAVAAFDRSLRLDPDQPAVLANRGRSLMAAGRLDEAVADLRAAIESRPDLVVAWTTLAAVHLARSDLQAAREAANRALALRPDNRPVHGVLARIALSDGDLRAAEHHARAGGDREVLGRVLRRAGRPAEAVRWLDGRERARALLESGDAGAALRAVLPPSDAADRALLVEAAAGVAVLPPDAVPHVVGALGRDDLALAGLDRVIRATLDARDEPDLVAPWLMAMICCDAAWQGRLASWWEDPEVGDAVRVQAFHTGFAWYGEPLAEPDPAFPEATRVQLEEPALERRLAADIPAITPIDDPVSRAVRDQYEEHPYPRLVGVTRKPARPLGDVLRTMFPGLQAPRGPRILVAGCGTGQQVLSAATRYAGAEVFAIDLSRASLGCAARLAARWGLDNVRFAQADLLALDLPDRFDLIEAGGVLHHLADPEAGWAVLRRHLAPGGLMKVGLYSARARTEIDAARALRHAEPRALRTAILALPEGHPARGLLLSADFYSDHGLRDLALHAHEDRFTFDRLEAALRDLDLRLVGLQHPDPGAYALYDRAFDDPARRTLSNWDRLEAEHPRLFASMIQLWATAG